VINSTTLVGRLGADPKAQYFESGSQVSRFTLYVNEHYKQDGQKQERTHRFAVEVWGGTAEYVNNYLRKGNLVGVSGSLAEDVWEDKENPGQNRSRVIVKANRIENLTPKKADDQAEDNHHDDEF